jgi:hypothetical protein
MFFVSDDGRAAGCVRMGSFADRHGECPVAAGSAESFAVFVGCEAVEAVNQAITAEKAEIGGESIWA